MTTNAEIPDIICDIAAFVSSPEAGTVIGSLSHGSRGAGDQTVLIDIAVSLSALLLVALVVIAIFCRCKRGEAYSEALCRPEGVGAAPSFSPKIVVLS
ncbi:hypothetical protein AAFF_G00397180 [Aldrovandia affinis]|uniref:Uncharacterized protein n=1 Tax=Aldrovandia affinis TaxID=143900 RepID=A0AAD7WKT4_9TELE|nr:hypothetical protein AAFF_G00397180 [Aldrovandia affinis]